MPRGKSQAPNASGTLVLRQLESLAERLSIVIRYEPGEMRGGLCRVGSVWQIIVNAGLSEDEKTEILAESLAQADLDSVYVSPRLRSWLERLRCGDHRPADQQRRKA